MKLLLSILLALGICSKVAAQAGPFSRPEVQRFGLDEGLPHRTTFSTAYDRDSILWLSTESAICRYDGYQISSYPQLSKRLIGNLKHNEDSLLYVIHLEYSDSLEVMFPDVLRSEGVRLTKENQGAFAGAVQRDNAPLYYAQGGFIFRYRHGEVPVVIHELGSEIQPGDKLISADPTGYILFRIQTGELEEYDDKEGILRTPIPYTEGGDNFQKEGKKLVFHTDQGGKTWIATAQGLYSKSPGSPRLIPGPALPTNKPVNTFFEDVHGRMIFSHLHPFLLRTQGLILYDDGQTHDLSWIAEYDDRIISISGTDFYRELNVSTHGGFIRVNLPENEASPFRKYLYDPKVQSGGFGHVMRGFTADNDGNVYTNKDTRVPYWFRINANTLDLDTLTMLDNSGRVVDNFGCGTNMLNYNGDIFGSSCTLGASDTAHVYRYRPSDDSWRRWQLPVLEQRIRWIMPTQHTEELLVVTEGTNGKKGGLFYFSPETGNFSVILPTGPEYDLEGYTKSGRLDTFRNLIWLGSTGGLYVFDPATDQLKRYQFTNGWDTEISDVYVQKDKSLLLGTFKKGLQRFIPEEERFIHVGGMPSDGDPYTQSSDFLQLPSNDVSVIRKTENHHLLVATFNGLCLHGHNPGLSSTYTTLDGLPSNEFNTPSLFFNEFDRRWYAGGINGFVSFRIADMIRPPSPFKPLILRTRYLDENEEFEQTKSLIALQDEPLVISPSVSYFSIEYTLPDYSGLRRPKYQTQLEGYDPQWRSPSESPSVRYTRVPPGNYTFKLKAIDSEGRVTPEIRELSVIVQRPWYETNLFYTLAAVFLFLLTWLYIYSREQRLRKNYRAKRQLQQLELRALRQQINPHFISNSMNAIRDFIFLKSPEKAAEYLTDFTRLMRLFLESSRHRFTTIKDEVDLLERYIRLEQLRYRGKFEYKFEIDDAIDQEMDEVPSLLLQPIVENAVNHGLCHLDNGGMLIIRITLSPTDEDTIYCTVIDNGVGRETAQTLKSVSSDHISRATQILEDRQRLLDADGVIRVDISTKDAYPNHPEQPGTEVTVRIEPVEEKV